MRTGIRASLILVGLMGIGSGSVFAQIIKGEGRDRHIEVVVVNSPAQPVPTQAQGTTNVSGDVNATVVGTPTVILGNSAANPVMVQNRDEPARQPFQHHGSFTLSGPFANQDSFTVPSGKQLVLEYVSFLSQIATGGNQIVLYSIENRGAGQRGIFRFLPQASINSAFDITEFVAERPVRIYCDADTDVKVIVTRNPSDGSDTVFYTVSGYLVDVP